MIYLFLNLLKRTFLRLLSYLNIGIKANYKLVRRLANLARGSRFPLRYKKLDIAIEREGHVIPVRIVSPSKNKPLPVLLHFHGGGWVTGNIDSYTTACANLALHTNCRVISVDYRLAPEYKFPIGLEDCYFATCELLANAQLLDIEADDITLIGDSAGANLVAAVSLMLRDKGMQMPKRQILLYPATYFDHHVDTSPFDSIREKSLGYILTSTQICDYIELYKRDDDDLKNPYLAPLLADLENQPKTLVITAEHDPLHDEGEAFARKLEDAGNDVTYHSITGALHGFFTSPPTTEPKLRECYKYINRFLKEEN